MNQITLWYQPLVGVIFQWWYPRGDMLMVGIMFIGSILPRPLLGYPFLIFMFTVGVILMMVGVLPLVGYTIHDRKQGPETMMIHHSNSQSATHRWSYQTQWKVGTCCNTCCFIILVWQISGYQQQSEVTHGSVHYHRISPVISSVSMFSTVLTSLVDEQYERLCNSTERIHTFNFNLLNPNWYILIVNHDWVNSKDQK